MLTTSANECPHDVAVYFAEHMLELSHISRRTISAKMRYQRLHATELELMRSIIHDELEESDKHLSAVDLQIGIFRNQLHEAGVAYITPRGRKYSKEIGSIRMFPSRGDQDLGVDYDAESSDSV